VNRSIIIISDLHISEGRLDDFDEELEQHLVSFLSWLAKQKEPVELVINGDFLDFVQAAPYSGRSLEAVTHEGIPLCFSEEQSVVKFRAILRAHPMVFASLRNFLNGNNNRLVVLPGNHDPDFFWPSIRREFTAAVGRIGSTDQVSFCLERSYRPLDYPWLWIEHGHQHDKINSFFVGGEERWSELKPPIFEDTLGVPRLCECIGTRFMIRYLNSLDASYPYVDNVKPFSRFLKIFGASALIPGWGPLNAAVAVMQMLLYLARTGIERPRDILSEDTPNFLSLNPVQVWARNATPAELNDLLEKLDKLGFSLRVPIEMALDRPEEAQRLFEFFSEHPDLLEGLGEQVGGLLGPNSGTLDLKTGYNANETQDLCLAARRIATQHHATTIIMGHTHEPVTQVGTFSYFNIGCWTRYYRFRNDEVTAPWRVLQERSYENFPFSMRYASISAGGRSATMETWRE
jgi:UDP-2,3-diacylglucosamine pyrophosphatase LpxH